MNYIREGGNIGLKITLVPKVYNHYISLGVNLLNRDWLVKSYQSFPPINLTQRSKLGVKKINYPLSYPWYKATYMALDNEQIDFSWLLNSKF